MPLQVVLMTTQQMLMQIVLLDITMMNLKGYSTAETKIQ